MKKVKWVSDNAFRFNFGVKPDFRVQFRHWSKTEFKTWFNVKSPIVKESFFCFFFWHFSALLSVARRILPKSTRWSRTSVSARPLPYIFYWTRPHISKSSTSRSFDHGWRLVHICFTTYYHLCFNGSFYWWNVVTLAFSFHLFRKRTWALEIDFYRLNTPHVAQPTASRVKTPKKI